MKLSILDEYHATRDFSNKAFRSACYAPTISLYFDTLGNVQACCQNTKYPLGNVATDRLRDIWNGERIRTLRKALQKDNLSAGCQFCEWQISGGNYTGTFTRNFERFPVEAVDPDWPAMMEFSISNTCNLECVMCNGNFSSLIRANREQLPPLPKPYGDRFFDELREFLPHLQFAKFLGGEPFLAQESYRIWEMMIEDNIRFPCHVTTNGTQYGPRMERVLEHIPMLISLSLDAATKETYEQIRINASYEAVQENFRRFHEYSRRHDTYFGLTYCLMPQNWQEFGDYLLFADEWDCEVGVNTVRDPASCSIYSLPIDELEKIASALEAQGEALVPRLHRNREVWETHVGAIRLRVLNQQESSRAPFVTPLSLIVVDRGSLESVPEHDRMTPQRAADALNAWSSDASAATLVCDKDDKVITFESANSSFLSLAPSDWVGHSFEDLVAALRQKHGAGSSLDITRSGHYVDRMIDFYSDEGGLVTIRAISVPTFNEFGLHGGSVTKLAAVSVNAHQVVPEQSAVDSLRKWSEGASITYLARDRNDVILSISGAAEQSLGIVTEDWVGKHWKDLTAFLSKRFGVERSNLVWGASPSHIDQVVELRSSTQLQCIRMISRRSFDSKGALTGWTTMIASVPVNASAVQRVEQQAIADLTAWSGKPPALRFVCDLSDVIKQAEMSSEGLDGLSAEKLIGQKPVYIAIELGQRFGAAKYGPDVLTAVYADRRIEYQTESGPHLLRGITLPHFDSSGRYTGSVTQVAALSPSVVENVK